MLPSSLIITCQYPDAVLMLGSIFSEIILITAEVINTFSPGDLPHPTCIHMLKVPVSSLFNHSVQHVEVVLSIVEVYVENLVYGGAEHLLPVRPVNVGVVLCHDLDSEEIHIIHREKLTYRFLKRLHFRQSPPQAYRLRG